MWYLILIVLFIAVFVFIGWRVLMTAPPAGPDRTKEMFVCPDCGQRDCICHKKPQV